MPKIEWSIGDYFYPHGDSKSSNYQIVAATREGYFAVDPGKGPQGEYTKERIDTNINKFSWCLLHPGEARYLRELKEIPNSVVPITTTGFMLNNSVLVESPTSNCQIASIANYADLSDYVDNRTERLKLLTAKTDKAMFLVDVRYADRYTVLDSFSKEDIVLDETYTSTNGSSMSIFLLKNHKYR